MSDAAATDGQKAVNISGAILAGALVALYWFLAWALIYKDIPQQNATNLAMVIGVVGNIVGVVMGWYFRSSQEARKQAETISTQATIIGKAQDKLAPVAGAPGASAQPAIVLVKPAEIAQADWDAMTDVDKAAVVLRYAK